MFQDLASAAWVALCHGSKGKESWRQSLRLARYPGVPRHTLLAGAGPAKTSFTSPLRRTVAHCNTLSRQLQTIPNPRFRFLSLSPLLFLFFILLPFSSLILCSPFSPVQKCPSRFPVPRYSLVDGLPPPSVLLLGHRFTILFAFLLLNLDDVVIT